MTAIQHVSWSRDALATRSCGVEVGRRGFSSVRPVQGQQQLLGTPGRILYCQDGGPH